MEKDSVKSGTSGSLKFLGILGVIVVVILIVALNQSDAPQATSDSNTQQSAPVTSASQKQENTVASAEDLRNCSQQAKTNFDSIILAETRNEADRKLIRTYTNHFNTREGKCFMVLTSVYPEYPAYNSMRLFDVYDNKMLANDMLGTCMITGGGDCRITLIFEEKMESKTY